MTITTTDEWQGFTRGEPVTVSGMRGSFTFEGYTRAESGHECVWVYGGSKNAWGKRSFRAVDPSRIRRTDR